MTETTSKALVPSKPRRSSSVVSYKEAKDFAEVAFKSRFFLNKDISTADKALALIMIGREMGLGPAASIRGVYLIDGVPNISSRVMAGLIKTSGEYDYETVVWTDEKAEIRITRNGVPQTPTSIFTLADAKRAGLIKDKSGWVKYPKNMLWARALTNAFGIHCPHLANGMPIYALAEEELTALEAPRKADKPVPTENIPDADFEPLNSGQGHSGVNAEQLAVLEDLIAKSGSSIEGIKQYHCVESLSDLTQEAYGAILKVLTVRLSASEPSSSEKVS